MPASKGYGSKHVTDRREHPGTVKSGTITVDAHGAQMPVGQVSLARKKGKRGG